MRGKIDDFGLVLIVALVLLAIAWVAASYVPGGFITPAGENYTIINEFTIGGIGIGDASESKTLSMGSFAIGEEQLETVKEVRQFSASRNLLTGEDVSFDVEVPDWLTSVMRSGELSFSVFETNAYGNLIVRWNGLVVYNGKPGLGGQTIPLSLETIKDRNTVSFETEGPGWLFWASTIYNIRDFEANIAYGPERIFAFQLSPSEIQALDGIEVLFDASGTGTLKAKINGYQVYSDSPDGVDKISFGLTDAPLKAGTNILTLEADKPIYLSSANLKVLVFSGQLEKQRQFNMTQAQFDLLNTNQRRGRIEVEVLEVHRVGALDLDLNGRKLDVRDLREGINVVFYRAGDVNPGTNTLHFSGTGSYNIGNVKIGLER